MFLFWSAGSVCSFIVQSLKINKNKKPNNPGCVSPAKFHWFLEFFLPEKNRIVMCSMTHIYVILFYFRIIIPKVIITFTGTWRRNISMAFMYSAVRISAWFLPPLPWVLIACYITCLPWKVWLQWLAGHRMDWRVSPHNMASIVGRVEYQRNLSLLADFLSLENVVYSLEICACWADPPVFLPVSFLEASLAPLSSGEVRLET